MKRVHFGSADPEPDSHDGESALLFASPDMPACLIRLLKQLHTSSQARSRRDAQRGGGKSLEIGGQHVQQLWERMKGTDRKSAWKLAMGIDPEYACSLIIPFLRSVDGSAKRAAKGIIRHFQAKLDLFGREKLVRRVELTDLDENDMEALNSGGFQVLPTKDKAGRPIMFGCSTCLRYREVKNLMRALFYMWSSMVEDEEHQTSGIVGIGFQNGKLPDEIVYSGGAIKITSLDHDLVRTILVVLLSLPVRPMGFHLCWDSDSNQWEGIFDMVVSNVGKVVSQRIRCHYGTSQENMAIMKAHGVPTKSIPISRDGVIDLRNHKRWIQHRIEIEAERRDRGVYIVSSWGREVSESRNRSGGSKKQEEGLQFLDLHNMWFSALLIPIVSYGVLILCEHLINQGEADTKPEL